MMAVLKLAVVQTDVELGAVESNIARLKQQLNQAADQGGQLIVFPECATTGYCFTKLAEVEALAEAVPGPSTEQLAAICAERNVWCVYGTIERDGTALYNTVAVIGPQGYIGKYRKTHLPCVGADRFTNPGNGPLQLFDIGGVKVGIGICFDGGFPEFPRTLALMGADLIVLPTNWAEPATRTAMYIPPVRALENTVYFAACNRIGTESDYRFIGHCSIYDPAAKCLAEAKHDAEVILLAEIDTTKSRSKKYVHCLGEYEIDRVNWRRPELYAPLVEPLQSPFRGHPESLVKEQ
jgi:predicted amidohydrolase